MFIYKVENSYPTLRDAIGRYNEPLEVIKKMVEQGEWSCVNGIYYYGDTALMTACCMDRLDIIKYLLSKGANLNQRDTNGMTALMYSVGYGSLETIKYLVEQGALVNDQDFTGRTPLMLANQLHAIYIDHKDIKYSKADIIEYLKSFTIA